MGYVKCMLRTVDTNQRVYADLYRDPHKSGDIWTFTKQYNEFHAIKRPANVQVFYAPFAETPAPSRSRSRSRGATPHVKRR